jgi:hypothetical protein
VRFAASTDLTVPATFIDASPSSVILSEAADAKIGNETSAVAIVATTKSETDLTFMELLLLN